MKDINIVYVNYFMRDDLLKSLRSLFVDIAGSSYDIKITVVDNSCDEENLEYTLNELHPEVGYINPGENLGFGRANNLGFEATESRYNFALNCDTLFFEGSKTVEGLIRYMDSNPRVGCVGPKLINMDGSLQYSCFRFDLGSILIKPFRNTELIGNLELGKRYIDRLLMKDFDHKQTREVDWVSGAAMVLRREVFEMAGGFDERYFLYLEDCDLCHRVWDMGFPVIYFPDVSIKHKHIRGSSRVSGVVNSLLRNKLSRIHLRSLFMYLCKWWGKHRSYRLSDLD